jgi:hypothetical protein
VRQGVQRGVCEPAPARGGAVVSGKGRLIFLYSWHSGIIISSHLLLDELERRFLRLLAIYTEADVQGQLIPFHEFR